MNDLPVIAKLLSEMHGHDVSLDDIVGSLKTIVGDPQRDVLLVSNGDIPLGMSIVTIVHKLPEKEVRVDDVIVSEAARGKGLGSELLHGCEAWARDHDADYIEFTSRSARVAANHLYQKLGYTIRLTNVYRKDSNELGY